VLGAGTAALATVVGTVLGVALARIPMPFKSALRVALIAPAVLPPYIIALAWTYAAGSLAFTLTGAIIVLTAAYFPLAMLATEVGLRRIDPRLEEAALLVTTPVRVLWWISTPLVLPNVIASALIVFVLAISEFSVPGLLRVRVFTTEVFTAFASLYDFGKATVLALPLLVVSSVVAGIAATVLRNQIVTTRRPLSRGATEWFNEWRFAGLTTVGCGILATFVVPLAALSGDVLRSGSVTDVVGSSWSAVVNSVSLAFVGATAVAMLAAVLGYARARAAGGTGAALDVLWIVLFTVPSTVVGIGLIGVWNREAVWGAAYGTPAMLVLVYLARFVPLAAVAVGASIRSVPASHEEAAAVAGAGWLRTLTRVVLPQVRLGLLAVWVIAFILAFGEVGASILVAPPGESTLPIRVYTLTANAPPGHVATLALFQSIVVLCPLALLGAVMSRRRQ
jgi:iron(III) transport system permease protein